MKNSNQLADLAIAEYEEAEEHDYWVMVQSERKQALAVRTHLLSDTYSDECYCWAVFRGETVV